MVRLGHSLGHLGKTKTKHMLREKYWFPLMNSMIDTAIDQCYECQVATKGNREEPIKVTNIPNRPWDTVSVDHGRPYPDGHYNLVLIDKRTRYPVVKSVPSTDFQTNKERSTSSPPMELRGELRATTDPRSILKSSMNLQSRKDFSIIG